MKRFILLLLFIAATLVSKAQIADNAIGVRLGYGGGISWQHKLSKTTRTELNVAFGGGDEFSTFRLTGLYQYVYRMGSGFHFYAGLGGSAGYVSTGNKYAGDGDNGVYLSLGGQLGIDYMFDGIPVQISIDAMPMFPVINKYADLYFDPALGIRYYF